MSWFEFVCTAISFAVVGVLLIGLTAFARDEVFDAPDPEERWSQAAADGTARRDRGAAAPLRPPAAAPPFFDQDQE